METQGTCLLKQKLPVDRGGRDGAKQQNTVDQVGFQVAIEREISKKLKRGREGREEDDEKVIPPPLDTLTRKSFIKEMVVTFFSLEFFFGLKQLITD